MYGSPARLRVEHQAARRSNGAVVVSTLLSLLVVVAAVAAVAWLVLRAPSSTVDSAERLEPVGTALPAPTEPPTLPTPIPTAAPEPTALAFTGEAPAVTGLPTVAAPQETAPQDAGPTPTPRIVALPAVAPPAVAAPAPTLPPAIPVESVPVVALQPVEAAPVVAPAAAPAPAQTATEPTPAPVMRDDDPFNIFSDEDGSGIVAAQNDALDRARALQNDASDGGANEGEVDPIVVPELDVAAIVARATDNAIVTAPDGSLEIVTPDVDAMVDEITAQATDPNRNPNVANPGRASEDRPATTSGSRRKSARDRINERNARRTTTSGRNNNPAIVPSAQNGSGSDNQGDCEVPFANLPADMRPDNFPFSNC